MDTTATRIDPEELLETKVIAQGGGEDARGERHERPAPVARLQPLHVHIEEVVIGQVNIDDELALVRLEELELLVVARRGGEDGANVDLMRQLAEQVLLERRRLLVAQVPDVNVVARRE